jgi:hypothetical protein
MLLVKNAQSLGWFEGAIKDHVQPDGLRHIKEYEIHVQIEGRVNRDIKNIPKGTPSVGFVTYLHTTSRVIYRLR